MSRNLSSLCRSLVRRSLNAKSRKGSRPRTLFLELLEDRCTPAIFTVNTLADFPDDGDANTMSLREAIAAAELAAGEDTIHFDPSLHGTITLNSRLDISNNHVTILGEGRITISGDTNHSGMVDVGDSGLFYISSDSDVVIDGFTLTGGYGSLNNGGALYVEHSSAVINHCLVTGNSAVNYGGGLTCRNYGSLTVMNSTVSNNSTGAGYSGGGIYNLGGTLEVINSTISENSAAFGGGIYSQGAGLTIVNSTISNNTANLGAGLFSKATPTSITNTTVSGNTAAVAGGGYGIQDAAIVTVANSTFSGNSANNGNGMGGGGIFLAASATNVLLYNTIVVNSLNGQDIAGISPSALSANNIVGDGTGGLNPSTNILNVDSSTVIDLVLRDNGGPTMTHALAENSIARDAGDNSLAVDANGDPLTTDQRSGSYARIAYGTVDIGAVEYEIPQLTPLIMTNGYFDPNDPSTPVEAADVVVAPGPSVTANVVQQRDSPIIAYQTLTVEAAGKSVVLDNLNNEVSGMLVVRNAANFTLVATGNVTIAELDVSGTVNLVIDGDLIVPDDVYASLVLHGSIQANRVFVYGTLGGSGTVTATSVSVTSGGLWAVGNSPGHVEVLGNVDFAGGILSVDLVQATAGYYDLTTIVGTAHLTGATLSLNLANYNPYRGDTFTILTATGGITGNFSNLSGGGTITQNGLTFTVTNTGTSIVVKVTGIPAATNRSFVQQLYSDILGRTADTTGLNRWTAMLDAGSSRQSVVDGIYNSNEHYLRMVNGYYQTYLGREADSVGLNHWVKLLHRGVSETVVIRGILASAEYYNRHGGNDRDFLSALYRDLLGRDIDSAGLSSWMAALLGGESRSDVIAGIQSSAEYETVLIDSAYEFELRRVPDPIGMNTWRGEMAGGLSAAMLDILLYSSEEYYLST